MVIELCHCDAGLGTWHSHGVEWVKENGRLFGKATDDIHVAVDWKAVARAMGTV